MGNWSLLIVVAVFCAAGCTIGGSGFEDDCPDCVEDVGQREVVESDDPVDLDDDDAAPIDSAEPEDPDSEEVLDDGRDPGQEPADPTDP